MREARYAFARLCRTKTNSIDTMAPEADSPLSHQQGLGGQGRHDVVAYTLPMCIKKREAEQKYERTNKMPINSFAYGCNWQHVIIPNAYRNKRQKKYCLTPSHAYLGLKVGRGIDLVRLMIILQCRVEWSSLIAASTTASLRLLCSTRRGHVMVHQDVMLLAEFLSSPNSPRYKSQGTDHDGASNTHHDANDGVSGLASHSRRFAFV